MIPVVKVLWSNQTEREVTWETEGSIRKRYPDLFTWPVSFEDETSFKGGGMKYLEPLHNTYVGLKWSNKTNGKHKSEIEIKCENFSKFPKLIIFYLNP